jgi:sugar lactone lactonase YvrE
LLNDVAIGPDGTAYVTESESGAVFRARGAGPALEPFVAPDQMSYPNGIAFARGALYVAHFSGIVRVDEKGTLHRLAAPDGVKTGGIDGMYECGGGLIGVQNGLTLTRIARFAIDADADRITSARALFVDDGTLPLPTTGALDGSALFLVANSDIDAVTPSGLAPGDRPRTTIVRIADACP